MSSNPSIETVPRGKQYPLSQEAQTGGVHRMSITRASDIKTGGKGDY